MSERDVAVGKEDSRQGGWRERREGMGWFRAGRVHVLGTRSSSPIADPGRSGGPGQIGA